MKLFPPSNYNFKTSYGITGGLGGLGGSGGPGIPGSLGSNHSQSLPQPPGGILWPSIHL
jgi:hypothetical protein